MAHSLTWQVLDQRETNECMDAEDLNALRVLIKNADEKRNGELLHSRERTAAQVNVLLDLYGHLLLFSRASQLSPFKTSTLFGIVHQTHEVSMEKPFSRVESYDYLRQLIVSHSVHRPPFSSMVFNIGEVDDIDTYMMSTYYRHYKMYVYCFVPREVATLRTVMLNNVAEAPPSQLPPLSSAIREDLWKEKVQEKVRAQEEAVMEEELPIAEVLSDAQRRAASLENPQFKAGIREQLETIRDAVTKRTAGRLDLIEEKLTSLETKVMEMPSGGNRSRQGSRGAAKKR